MLTDTVTLNSEDYDRRWDKENSSLFGVAGLTAPVTKTLSVQHQEQGKGAQISDRRLVRFDHTLATSEGDLVTASAYVVLVIPRDAVVTATVVDDLVDDLSDFFVEPTNGPVRLAKLLNGES